MQSRRHEDFDRRPRNTDGYLARQMEGPSYPERRRSISLERRRPFDDGVGRRVRSRSPVYMEAKRGHAFYRDDWVTDRDLQSPEPRSRYEFVDRIDRKHDDVGYSPARNELGYGHGSSRAALRDDKFEVRRFDGGIRELSSQKSAVMGLYKSTGDVGPISKPETTGDLIPASLNIGLGQIGKERVHYPDVRDSYSFDKFTSVKHYGDEDKKMAHPRDASYSSLTAIRANEPIDASASHFKDYTTTSPRKSRIDHLDYRGGMAVSRDSPPLNSRHMLEPLPHSRYEQRQHMDLHRDTDLEINDDVAPYREGRFSPPRTGHFDSFRLQPRTREKDDYLYPSDEIYEKMDLRERVGYNGRDVLNLKPNLLDRVTHRGEASDLAPRNMSGRRSLDRIPLTVTNKIRLSRSPVGNRESAQYLDPVSIHSRLGRKVTREDEMPYIERRVDYDYNRGLSPGSHKERMKSFRGVLYEREHKMEDHDLPPYDSSSRYLKRKDTMEDEENRIPSRNMMSRLDTVYRRDNREFRDEEWIDQDSGRSYYSERTQNIYDDDHDDDEYIYDPNEFVHDHDRDHDHHTRSHTYDDKHAKGYYPRSSGRVGYNSYYSNRRSVVPRWKNMAIRSENDKDDSMYSREVEQYDPHEDTKEFKQLVNDHFLSFTKKLNENLAVRRKYLEQGRAGSLFCNVCGRSVSKEFLDTQRLAMHAFMSHKGGLRAQHLGFLKAICVMLGWNSVLPADSPRWFPETLPAAEALAQKQDLIIWPPVVIVHNISILNNNSIGEGPTTVEALGQYLRGLGLSGGKVKLGKHANCSIMLVKFLGTFSGLQEAEKIHEYFSKKKHGRKHLEQMSSSKGKSNWDDKEAERVLFGYMGIAEDLDKVDMDTKRKCSIKSKKEIQDIADAPVKPGE